MTEMLGHIPNILLQSLHLTFTCTLPTTLHSVTTFSVTQGTRVGCSEIAVGLSQTMGMKRP